MKRLFIIILDPNADATIIRDRIAELGDYYIVYKNQYLVLADLDTARDVYERLMRNEEQPTGIVVLCTSTEQLTYWGYSNKKLWEWLGEHASV